MSSPFVRHSRGRVESPQRRRFRKLLLETLETRSLLAVLPPADLVSWYRAEGDASDSAGSNHGVLESGTTFTAGKVGQAFFFDGVDDRVSVADIDDSLEPGSSFTVEAWVNPSSSGHGRPIAEKRAGNGNSFTFETTHSPFAPNDGLQFVVWIGGVQQNFLQTPAGVLQNNIWQHVAATYDGSALRIFVDGVEQASSLASGAIDLSSAPVAIGLNSVAAFAWHGAIDELSFYSRALAPEEIQSIVDADSEGKDPNAALIVTTTADSGPGSLRAAIEFANSDPDIDSISFAIPGDGPHTISPLSPLPVITEPVEIDGYTQGGTTSNESFDGLDTVLMIALDGSLSGQAHGLVVAGGDSTITGLAIHSFAGDGIRLESEDNIVAGNFIGTDISGTQDRGNGGHGVAVVGPPIGATTIYENDFEALVGSEWSTATTSVTPIGERRFLGELGSETATLTIPASSIPQGTTALTVTFDLFAIRSWDGNHTGGGSGPDRFQLSLANGLNLIDTTFSNNVPASGFAGQAYPGTFGSGQFDPLTGASEIDSLGYEFGEPMDSVYRPRATFSYSGGDVVLNFTGVLTTPGADESWGLDNVEVQAITGGFSAASDFSFDSNPTGPWSYGWTTSLGSAFNLYPNKHVFLEMQFWADNAISNLFPSVFYNPTDHSIDQGRHLPQQLSVHPGGSGQKTVVRWTAPADDSITVSSLFTGGDLGTSTDVHVLHNGTPLFDGLLTKLHVGPAFETELDVLAGDTIDFVIGDGGNGFNGDSTALDAVIYSSSDADADDNEIGGTSAAARNVIAFNGGDGVHVAGSESSATVLNNFIYANDGLGIDLAGGVEDEFGVTASDADDSDQGPSDLQNEPTVVGFTSFEEELALSGELHSSPSEVFRIEFFTSDAADPSGHGEGQRLLGVRQVTTDATGHIAFIHELPGVPGGTWLTMTATDADGNTSEFSPAVLIADQSAADLEITISDSPDPAVVGEPLTYTITVTNHGPDDATGVVVSASSADSTEFNSVMVPFGNVPSGQTRSLQLVFTPQSVGTFQATASVIGGEDDPNSGNNSATESTVVEPNSTIELAAATYEVSEGDGTAVLTVRRTGGLNASASVDFTTSNGTAGQRGISIGLLRTDDFTTTSGTLFFRPRSNIATIRVPIRDDAAIEGDESFRVVLSNPSKDAKLGAITEATVTIHDNDPSINFAAGNSETTEATSRNTTLSIPVRLSHSLPRPVTVTYTVTGGSATFGQDFTPQTGTLTFGPRATTRSIPLQIIGDSLFELDETVVIELSNPVGAFLGASTRHRVTINNDDPQPPPPDPGSTPLTALPIDLQTRPRQSYSQYISRTDIETFSVELGANEQLILDVDPGGLAGTLLPSSTMTIIADDGVTVLATVGASAEPEGGRVTNNPATLFQADADGGTYFIRLATTATAKSYGYTLHFHRIGVSEEVPSPELLNVPGSMYAWFDGVDTVGITGPTGYGFTLEGAWQQVVVQPRRSVLRSQTLMLPSGSQFTMRSPQGVELPLLANGPIVINTASNRFGNVVGAVTTTAINFPVSLAIEPINDLLAEALGSEFAAVGLLSGQWRISLGASVLFADGRNANRPVEETLAGIPYLRQKGPINFNANLGGFSLDYSVIETPIEWIFDPADPMLYVKADKVGDIKEAALAVSLHGLIEFKPQDAPDPQIDAGVTEFFGHIYGTAKIPFKIGPLPMEVEAEIVVNVDADRDGLLLGDLRDVDELFDILQGDFSEVREIVNDVQLGANGTLLMTLQQKKEGETIPAGEYTMESGRASVVLDGLEETIWVRAQQGGDLLSPDWLKRLNSSSSIVTEGLVTWDGEFFLSTTTSYSAGGIDFEYEIGFTHEGIFARIRGAVDWSVKFEYQGIRVSGTAIAEIEANVAIEFDNQGVPHFSGSITSSGKLRYKGTNVFSGSIASLVRSRGFRFSFPRGVGNIDLDLF